MHIQKLFKKIKELVFDDRTLFFQGKELGKLMKLENGKYEIKLKTGEWVELSNNSSDYEIEVYDEMTDEDWNNPDFKFKRVPVFPENQ